LTPSQPQQLAPLAAAAAADTTNATTVHNSLSLKTPPLSGFIISFNFFFKNHKSLFCATLQTTKSGHSCYGIFLDILRRASDLMFLDTSSCTAYSVVAVSIFEVKYFLRVFFLGMFFCSPGTSKPSRLQ